MLPQSLLLLRKTLPYLLSNCSFFQLHQIHGLLVTSSWSLSSFPMLYSLLVRRATEFGSMDYAENLFASPPSTDAAPLMLLYNAMIRGYAYNGPWEKSLHLFEEMIQRSLRPNSFTYPYVIDSCTYLGKCWYGKKCHCQVIKGGFDVVPSVGSSLLKFYVETRKSCTDFGTLTDAQRIFDNFLTKSVSLWNRMISEYVNFGDFESARRLFDKMPDRDAVSWNSMLSGYLRTADLARIQKFFSRIPVKDVISWTSMIKALANAGDIREARRLFDGMIERSVVSWNCMLSAYTQHGMFRHALDLFLSMQTEGVVPDSFTFVSSLSACAHLGDLDFGKWIHCILMTNGLQLGTKVGTALVEMYAKCGDIDRSFNIFIKMVEKDVFCWNVMIKAFAEHGRIQDAMELFESMKRKGLRLNDLTFMSVLFACSHGGLVHEGRQIFDSMVNNFGVHPRIEHFGCFIDLLCRSGLLEEAQLVIKHMPYEPDIVVWGALLGGCRIRNDLKLAGESLKRISELETDESGIYVLLSNMHANYRHYNEALDARRNMEKNRIRKTPGSSVVIEIVDAC